MAEAVLDCLFICACVSQTFSASLPAIWADLQPRRISRPSCRFWMEKPQLHSRSVSLRSASECLGISVCTILVKPFTPLMIYIYFKNPPVPASNWETVPVLILQSLRFALSCFSCCCRAIRWAMSASGPGSCWTKTPSHCPGGFCLEECASRSPTTATHPPSTRP